MWSGLSTRQDRATFRLDCHHLQARLARLQQPATACKCAARADAGQHGVDCAIRICPDLFSRRLLVDFRIGRIVELARHNGAGCFRQNFLRLGDGAAHPLLFRGQNQLGAEIGQHLAPLDGHGFRHGQDQAIAPAGRRKGEADAGVSRRRLNQHAAR